MQDVVEVQAATCGIILEEVLQGIHPAEHVGEACRSLLKHTYLDTPQAVYLKAAEYIRHCRRKGLGLSTVDALIAAVAAQHEAELWTLDKDLIRAGSFLSVELYPSLQ